jgi:CcmD family protein
MNGSNGFVIAAYTVMWVGLLGYAIRLHRVFRDARQRLDAASRTEGRSS